VFGGTLNIGGDKMYLLTPFIMILTKDRMYRFIIMYLYLINCQKRIWLLQRDNKMCVELIFPIMA